MNSEKMKEIKEALECCKQNEIEETCGYCLVCPASNWDYEKTCTIDLFQKALTLINELESKNRKLKQHKIELQGGQQDLTRRIAEVEKENALIKSSVAMRDYKTLEEISNNKVKQFAEKMKAKSYVNNYCREVVEIDKIDELLKEYE